MSQNQQCHLENTCHSSNCNYGWHALNCQESRNQSIEKLHEVKILKKIFLGGERFEKMEIRLWYDADLYFSMMLPTPTNKCIQIQKIILEFLCKSV